METVLIKTDYISTDNRISYYSYDKKDITFWKFQINFPSFGGKSKSKAHFYQKIKQMYFFARR